MEINLQELIERATRELTDKGKIIRFSNRVPNRPKRTSRAWLRSRPSSVDFWPSSRPGTGSAGGRDKFFFEVFSDVQRAMKSGPAGGAVGRAGEGRRHPGGTPAGANLGPAPKPAPGKKAQNHKAVS